MINKSYPADLTNKAWQKAKGIVAKASVKTGVGEALTKCEKSFPSEFHKNFAELLQIERKYNSEKGIIGKKESSEDLKSASQLGSALSDSLRDYEKNLESARKLADKAEKLFKSSKTIPSSSTKAAANLVQALDDELEKIKKIPDAGQSAGNAIKKYRDSIPEFPSYPSNMKELKKFLDDQYWAPVFAEQAKKVVLIDTLDFLKDIRSKKLGQETYDKYIGGGLLNASGKTEKIFHDINKSEEKDWTKAPWADLVDSQLVTFYDNVYCPILNKTK
jgi:Sec-independent protein translocase protein TatA